MIFENRSVQRYMKVAKIIHRRNLAKKFDKALAYALVHLIETPYNLVQNSVFTI